MIKNLSIIITLYKTPIKYLKNLNQYKNYKIYIFDQATKNNSKIISRYLKCKFVYFNNTQNIGLPKATNYLISKIKTDFFLFTQADIKIDNKSIENLFYSISTNKKIIFAGPTFNRSSSVIKNYRNKFVKYTKKLDASLMMCDAKKVKKIGFFGEDFFLYWEDKDLMERVNKSNFKMIRQSNSFAYHESSKSSSNNLITLFIRRINFKFGEYLFELKHKKIRKIKVFRNIFINLMILPVNLIFLRKNKLIENISQPIGTIKFILFLLFR